MGFEYKWGNKEANFGPPQEKQVVGGTHVTFEIILKKGSEYIALRRPNGIPEHELPPQAGDFPEGLLYFCHNLIRYGESLEECIGRIVHAQAGVAVDEIRVVHPYSEVQEKDHNWSINPVVIAEAREMPQKSEGVSEVVVFTKDNIPDDFAWWSKKELTEFLMQYD